MRRSPWRTVVAATLAGATAAGVLTSCGAPDAEETARSFLSAWQAGHGRAAGRLTTSEPGRVAKHLDRVFGELDAGRIRVRLDKMSGGDAGKATAAFVAKVRLRSLGTDWSYRGRFTLRESAGRWRVVWAPDVVHPALRKDYRLRLSRKFLSRAPILAANGARLQLNENVVVVGVVPEAMKDETRTLRVLADHVGIDAEDNAARIDAAPPSSFLPLITLRYADYLEVKDEIYELPGVRFRSDNRPLAKNRGYARQVLGTVGPVTAERLDQLGSPYTAADKVGRYGLQRAYERRIAGVPEGYVLAVDASGATRRTLAKFAGRAGRPVRTTLDVKVQDAAERALDTVRKPAALVAVRASTGEVLAVANRPVDDAFNRALVGRYPPGSTFKVVTTAALLEKEAVRPGTTVDCPRTIRAGGRSFGNFASEALPSATFREDFAISCNTAFIRLARKLAADDLRSAASSYGFGAEYTPGLRAYSGQVPESAGAADHAAASIGQGRVLASPLTMALVAAAVRGGTWHPPTLVTRPEPAQAAEPVRLDPRVTETLRSLMRSVVTSGTGSALADVPGAVAGKTGTAEYGSADPPRTHAWFIGFRGDLAFAVMVEGGGVGSEAAVPVAEAFLRHN